MEKAKQAARKNLGENYQSEINKKASVKVKNTKINQQINIYTFTIQNIKLQSKTTNIDYSQSTSIYNIILISKENRQITAY